MSKVLYRLLVPDAPANRRTEVDPPRSIELSTRKLETNPSLHLETIVPGLKSPSLVSSYDGKIQSILLCFPKTAVEDSLSAPAYQSVIQALSSDVEFVVVTQQSCLVTVQTWFNTAGHDKNVKYITFAEYINFTDWAEDAYVSLVDKDDGTYYLVEPWEFGRAGDALIADKVEEHTDIRATQAPLIFQGGNCLIGKEHWLLGKDYFSDSVDLIKYRRPPVTKPDGITEARFVTDLFKDFLDSERELVFLGSEKPLPLEEYVGAKEGSHFILDIPADGAGKYQPIFHIDMFVTLVGERDGKFRALVGDPTIGDKLLGRSAPYALGEVYDLIANQLSDLGFDVIRNPLVHWPTESPAQSLKSLNEAAISNDNEPLSRAVANFRRLGANDKTSIRIRSWHHITWNNCLVEADKSGSGTVYLPSFGHGTKSELKTIDDHMRALWEKLGFSVKMLGDFNNFARRQGVVHCIKKYLRRAS